MRWKYPDESDVRERLRRQEVLARIDRWWREFDRKKADCDALFTGRKEWDLPAWMRQHLGPVSDRLMWEFGPGPRGGHVLVITPEGEKRLRPLAEAVLARAPRLKGWSFASYRPPCPVDGALQVVEAKGGGDLSDVRAQARVGEHHLVDLSYRSPMYATADDDDDFRAALWLTESLVGEETLDRWVGLIGTAPVEKGPRLLPLDRLKETVDAVIESITEQMPEEPCWRRRDGAEWTQWQLRPAETDDPPGQADLIVASSFVPALWLNAHSDRSFCSRRFSRCGETFCYLKIDGSARRRGEEAAYRQDIEEEVDEALGKAGIGGAVGGGSGVAYCYVDLAVTDVPRAAEVVRQVLRGRRVPVRSWLLFYDSDLADEWLGVWDESPLPPGLRAE